MSMKTEDRKAAIAAYKERKVVPGVFAVRCLPTGEAWVGHAPDLATIRNRIWFTLDHGSYRVASLQAAWNTHCAAGFVFEELERIEADQPAYARDAALKERTAAWMKELGAAAI
jgi:hypothetical protein